MGNRLLKSRSLQEKQTVWEIRSSQHGRDSNSMRQKLKLQERSAGTKLIPIHVPSVEPANYLLDHLFTF